MGINQIRINKGVWGLQKGPVCMRKILNERQIIFLINCNPGFVSKSLYKHVKKPKEVTKSAVDIE